MNKNLKYAIGCLSSMFVGAAMVYVIAFQEKQEIHALLDGVLDTQSESYSVEAMRNVFIAKAIRNNDFEIALDLLDSNIESNVEHFTNQGRNLKSLTERELKIYYSIRDYWSKSCEKSCLKNIEYIFNDTYKHHSS